MEVSEDHTFNVTGFPVDFRGVGTKPELASGSGKWRLAPAIKGVRWQELSLLMEGTHFDLAVGGNSEEVLLLWEVGDPDYSYRCEFAAEPLD
ncbi:hypothetical protein [Streptomyces sp. NPDC058412]|uniref:hypothetical protein n=1 Tax=unclassified Streptomyces TaxID=2593676 RepID=UPI00364D4FCE